MANIRTGNIRAGRLERRRTFDDARSFHEAQVARMHASGTLHKLAGTRYVLARARKDKAFLALKRGSTTVQAGISGRMVRTTASVA